MDYSEDIESNENKDSKQQQQQQKQQKTSRDQDEQDPVVIPRVVKTGGNDHEHPSPYSSNYRTDRDNTL